MPPVLINCLTARPLLTIVPGALIIEGTIGAVYLGLWPLRTPRTSVRSAPLGLWEPWWVGLRLPSCGGLDAGPKNKCSRGLVPVAEPAYLADLHDWREHSSVHNPREGLRA